MNKSLTLKLVFAGAALSMIWQAEAGTVVTGKVIGRDNVPLAGAGITCDKAIVAVCASDGSFAFELPGNSGTVSFGAEGYISQEYFIEKSGAVQVKLEPELEIRTPYFEKPLQAFNGSSATVTGEQIKGIPAAHLSNTLTGILPGLITIQASGEPGSDGATMYIRGRRTSAEGILIVIDGQPGTLANLQPTDIETVTILKDASALALYGMRASNGAMVITTKRGMPGKMKINVSAQAAYQQFSRPLQRVNSATFARMYNEAMYNEDPNQNPRYGADDIARYADGSDPVNFPDIDWYGDLLRDGTWTQRYNVDISGGGGVTRYYVALGAQFQSGMFNTEDDFTYKTNTNFNRYNFRSNVDFRVTKTTSVGVSIAMRLEKSNSPGSYNSQSNIFTALMQTPPNAFPMYYEDNGTYVDNTGNKVEGVNGKIVSGSAQTTIANPWAMINRTGYSFSDRRYGVVNITASQKLDFITQGLSLDAHLSNDIYSEQLVVRNKTYANYELKDDGTMTMRGTNGTMDNTSDGLYNTRNTTVDAGLGYSRMLGGHDLKARAFFNMYETALDYTLPTRYIGFGGLVSYAYSNKYSADLTFAYQGSNLFPSDKRFAFTPALALGWLVSGEDFMGSQKTVSYLKLRASAGQLANSRGIDYYAYLSALTQVNGVMREGVGTITGYPGYDETKVANPNVTWEKSLQWNVGFDAGFFGDRLFLTADYFEDYRRDMYMTPSTFSQVAGLSDVPKVNIGSMKSRGLEIAASWSDAAGDFKYTLGGNFTTYRNEIVNFDEPAYQYAHMYQKGGAIDAVFGLAADGFYRDQADIDRSVLPNFATVHPGDIKYISQTGLPYIDATYDQTRISNNGYTPKVFYAANIGLEYKGVDLNVMFQGAARVTRIAAGTMRNTFTGEGSFYDFQLDHWTGPESVDAKYPRLTTTANQNSNRNSTFWLRDGSYLRLKTAELGYTFDPKLTRKIAMEKLRIFVSGYNLFILSDKIGVFDPEGNANGTGFPVPRIFNVGINITF